MKRSENRILTTHVGSLPTLDSVDEQTIMQTAIQAVTAQTGAVMGLVGRWPVIQQSFLEALGSDSTGPDEADEEAEVTEPEEPEARDPNRASPGSRTGRQRGP